MTNRADRDLREMARINAMREFDLIDVFQRNLGARALLLMSPFPFLVIGTIRSTAIDFVLIDIETTHVTELEGSTIRINVETIEAFYIEEPGMPPIPEIDGGGGGGENHGRGRRRSH